MSDCIVYGPGQLGRLFAGAALSLGHRVTPITRATPDPRASIDRSPASTPILLTVSESALPDCTSTIPSGRHADLVFVQNELFPVHIEALLGSSVQPTVLVFWSNVKPGKPVQVGRPSSVFGPHADFVAELHAALTPSIPCNVLENAPALIDDIIAKYAFILTINALGLRENRTLAGWLDTPAEVQPVLADATRLGALLARVTDTPDTTAIASSVFEAMRGLADISSRGRSAPQRLDRALALAEEHGVEVPALQKCLPVD